MAMRWHGRWAMSWPVTRACAPSSRRRKTPCRCSAFLRPRMRTACRCAGAARPSRPRWRSTSPRPPAQGFEIAQRDCRSAPGSFHLDETRAAACLLLLCHHIASDGWSLAPLARDLSQAYAARSQGKPPPGSRCRCSTPTTRCGSTNCWATRRPAASSRGNWRYWQRTLADLPEQLVLPTDRPRPAVSSYRGETSRSRSMPGLHQLAALAREGQASLFMVLQAALAACSPAWARAPTFHWAARSPGAPTRRWTTSWASSSTRWCCAPTPRATRAFVRLLARVRETNLAPTSTRTCRSSAWWKC
jgi:hypothetical protein